MDFYAYKQIAPGLYEHTFNFTGDSRNLLPKGRSMIVQYFGHLSHKIQTSNRNCVSCKRPFQGNDQVSFTNEDENNNLAHYKCQHSGSVETMNDKETQSEELD